MKNRFLPFFGLRAAALAMAAFLAISSASAHHEPGHEEGVAKAPKARARPDGMQDPVVVMELFTTAGCAKCPPADALLKQIRDEVTDNDIVFGCHVTYFDQSVRKDPISLPACDDRHKTYEERQAIENFFVPQLIVDGRYPSKGNEEKLVRSAYNLGRAEGGVQPLEMHLTPEALEIALPDLSRVVEGAADFKATLWLLSYEEDRIFTITGNPGEEPYDVHYVNGVRDIRDLGAWDGQSRAISLALRDLPEGYGYAVLAQDPDSMQILAAGKAEYQGMSVPPGLLKDPQANQSLQKPKDLKTP